MDKLSSYFVSRRLAPPQLELPSGCPPGASSDCECDSDCSSTYSSRRRSSDDITDDCSGISCDDKDCDCRLGDVRDPRNATAAAAAGALDALHLRSLLSSKKTYTACEVRRNDSIKSCWIVANGNVYDCTSYLGYHPGGFQSILKYAGGKKDCAEDLKFHSSSAVKLWSKMKIGRVVPCASEMLHVKETNVPCSVM